MKPEIILAICLFCLAQIGPRPAWAQGRPGKMVERLEVNTSMAHRAMAHKSLSAGIADMTKALASAEFEELWAFIPGQKLWVEIGCCERRTPRGNHVGVDRHLLELMKKHSNLAVYHIHPHTHFIKENYSPEKRRLKIAEEALPSLQDMRAMLKLTRMYKGMQPNGEISWFICSRHGITRYGIEPQAAGLGKEPSLKPFFFSPFEEDEIEGLSGLTFNEVIETGCERLGRDGFAIGFISHD